MAGLLQKSKWRGEKIALAFICITAFSLMLWASFGDAGIMDELAHIPAGYGYVHNLDYRLNPEHPPFVKAVAAFPLLFMNLNFPTQDKAWTTDVNGQWDMGRKFFYESGNNADQIIRAARLGPMLLTIILILFVYVWALELLGSGWALLPAFLVGLSPTVLAHGHYVTTDIGAALGIVTATYFFVKFLLDPTRSRLLFAGLAFGFAQICKFSAVLLVPYFIVLAIVFAVATAMQIHREKSRQFFREIMRVIGSTIAIFVLGFLLVVYPVYFLFTVHYPIEKQISDTTITLGSYANGPQAFQECLRPTTLEQKKILGILTVSKNCDPMRGVADLNIWITKNNVTRPLAEYMLGVLMVTQRAAGGNTGYFMGQVSAAGWHSYFPIVYLLKEPIPVLILVTLALLWSVWSIVKAIAGRRTRFFNYLGTSFPEFAMIAFVLFYWAYSIKSPLNIGFRHLMPIIPFTYILTASALKRWISEIHIYTPGGSGKAAWLWMRSILSQSLKRALVIACVGWLLAETLASAPYFLSYFNEAGGTIWGGYKYVTDSNYDWGQDMLRLQSFVAAHPEIDKIAVDYFGAGTPKYYLGEKEENWWSARGNPANQGIHWLAVSVNTLQGAIQPKASGFERKPEDEYGWLTSIRPATPGTGNLPKPDFRAGTSIFIYHL